MGTITARLTRVAPEEVLHYKDWVLPAGVSQRFQMLSTRGMRMLTVGFTDRSEHDTARDILRSRDLSFAHGVPP